MSVIFAVVPAAYSAALIIPAASVKVDAVLRDPCIARSENLQREWSDFEKAETDFYREFGRSITSKHPRKDEALRRKGVLEAEARRIRATAASLAKRIELLNEDAELKDRLDEADQQIRRLGFKQRSMDFERYAILGNLGSAELQSRLISRLHEIVDAGTDLAMQDHFIKWLHGKDPYDVLRFANNLEQSGVSDPFFLAWLRGLAPKEARIDLAAKAAKGVGLLKAHLGRKSAQTAVDTHLETAIAVVQLFTGHPVVFHLKALKEAASGLYEGGEAVFIGYLLTSQVDDLLVTTDAQLNDLKRHAKKIEVWMKRRSKIGEELKTQPLR